MEDIKISDVFDVNSEFYNKILEIIKNPNPLNEKYTEKHHIIPRFVYRDLKLEVNNNDTNLINLSIKNHILIHYYMAKCCYKQYKWKCLISILRTLGNIKLSDFENHIEELSEQIADTKKMFRENGLPDEIKKKCGWNHYRLTEEERKEKFGVWKGKSSPRLGKKNSKEHRQKISISRKGKLKGHEVSLETRQKISEKAKNRPFKPHSKESIEQGKITNNRRMAIKIDEFKKYKEKYGEIGWNEWQKKFSEFIKNEHKNFNKNKPNEEKLNTKEFRRKFYEDKWARFVDQ